jgi:cytoskeleton protein RodZ
MTIGEILKQARTERQLTLEQAAKLTHIRPHYLEALENDRLDSLPSNAQAKGFLRLYASFLGVAVQPILEAWEKSTAGTLEPAEAPEPVIAQPSSPQEESAQTTPQKRAVPAKPVPRPLPSNSVSAQVSSEATGIFKEVGQTLRQQRESLGLSLNDVEQFTHVRLHYLEAIEEGSLEKLPSPVQGRGMISNYARFLDLDGEKILLRFADGLQTQHAGREPDSKNAAPIPRTPPGQRPAQKTPVRRLVTPDLLIGGFIVIALVMFAAWSTYQVIKSRNQQANLTVPGIPDVLLVSASPDLQVTTTQIPTLASESGSPIPEQTFPGNELTQTLIPASNAPLQVYVIAHLRTYMKVTVDGEVQFDGRVVPGIAYPFGGNTQIELAAGNGAALQVYFNQTDLGAIGLLGESISLNFTMEGIQTPTPLFTPTPTVTEPATATLLPSATPQTPTITPMIP